MLPEIVEYLNSPVACWFDLDPCVSVGSGAGAADAEHPPGGGRVGEELLRRREGGERLFRRTLASSFDSVRCVGAAIGGHASPV